MTKFEKGVKTFAIVLAIVLCFSLIGGIITILGGAMKGFRQGAESVSDAVTYAADQAHSSLKNGMQTHLDGNSEYFFTTEEVDKLNIQNGIGDMTIRESDNDKIHVSLGNEIQGADIRLSGNTLKIENVGVDVKIFGVSVGERVEATGSGLTVEIPRGTVFDEASIENGIGNMKIAGLQADTIKITSGTGQLECENLDAEKIKVKSGIGQIQMKFDCPMDTYDMRLEPGVGAIIVNGIKQNKIQHTNRDADQSIQVTGSIGEIQITFNNE